MTRPARFDLDGRVALMTGANSGIGYAIAVALVRSRADIVVGVRNLTKADAVRAEIEGLGRRCTVVCMDVTDLEGAIASLDAAEADSGPIDVLTNNAGGGIGDSAMDVKPGDFDYTMLTNVKTPFFLSQAVARKLVKAGRPGDIVNVSSQAGIVALPGEPIYCMDKAAVFHMTCCLAVEWGEHDNRVNAVALAFIKTPGTAAALSDPAFKSDTVERIAAAHRLGTPKEVAECIAFLASRSAPLLTGHNIVVDGGWTVR